MTLARDESGHLSDLLEAFSASVAGDRIALGAISDFVGRRSIGALLLILALPMALPVPAPGLSVLFGIPLILVSFELMLGRRTAWLPEFVARRSIRRDELIGFIARTMPRLRSLEQIIKPRLSWMASDWTMTPVGAVCLILALVITLPIPLGHMVPGAAISILALGLMERDGLAISVGLLVALLALTIVILASMGFAALLRAWIAAI
ncbi:MAG TPA: exopolysaccharide biosynthesis protein [Stellaceae bacterium]|jgi:hypothetical protein|nr:exopolysaccharide biosynthesis protein [Stellaceae bacterium]